MVLEARLRASGRPALTGPPLSPQTKEPTDILTEWSAGISALMTLVTKTTHLINKEEMVHKHLLPSAD